MDAELVKAVLEGGGFELNMVRVDCEKDFRLGLREIKPDIIISDFSLPLYNGKHALKVAQDISPRTPFIFYSGTIGEEIAIDALREGATDYVLKQKPRRLVSAVKRALDETQLKETQAKAEQKIKAQAQLLDLARDAIVACDMETRVVYWNHGAEQLYGYSRKDAEGEKIEDLIHLKLSTSFEDARQGTLEAGYWEGDMDHRTKDNRTILVTSHWTLVTGAGGLPERILTINTDITEKKQLEKQFLRAQRQESIGTLAGGIAHDLNNILAPIFMASELLQNEPLRPSALELLIMIQRSAQRGADMVKQVLMFVRGSESKRAALVVSSLLVDICKVARETFPKNIEVKCVVDPELGPVRADATQITQVLMNLCVNARDAMPSGGTLGVSAVNSSTVAGPCVLIQVSDTGMGIAPEILDKIFDPFFTTKPVGAGTGLGLSTVHGIVKNHKGTIKVDSTQGVGTSFQISLPVDRKSGPTEPLNPPPPPPRGMGELIMIVDDEADIRNTVEKALVSHGYEVLVAEGGKSALSQFIAKKNSIKLVITDLMMPEVDGSSLARTLLAIDPKLKLIMTSGLAEASSFGRADQFLEKPFSADTLLRAVHDVLSKSSKPSP